MPEKPQIRKIQLGNTDLKVSVLGFGSASLGGVYGDADVEPCRACVKAALEAGVNFFDTSPYYGNSEEMLGKCLEGVPRDAYVIATKLGRYPEGEEFNYSAENVRQSVERSIKLLGCGTIDLIQVHDIEFANLDQVVKETLPAIEKLRAEGLIKYVGITSYCLEKFVYVIEQAKLLKTGKVDTIQTYARLSLLDNSLLDMAPYFKAQGIGVMNGSPLNLGLLSGGAPPDWHGAPSNIKETCVKMTEWCKNQNLDLASVSLAYTFDKGSDFVTLMGTKTASRMWKNVEAYHASQDEKVMETYRKAYPGLFEAMGGGSADTTRVVNGKSIHNALYNANIDA